MACEFDKELFLQVLKNITQLILEKVEKIADVNDATKLRDKMKYQFEFLNHIIARGVPLTQEDLERSMTGGAKKKPVKKAPVKKTTAPKPKPWSLF